MVHAAGLRSSGPCSCSYRPLRATPVRAVAPLTPFVGFQSAGRLDQVARQSSSRPDFHSTVHGAITAVRRAKGGGRQVTRMMPIGTPRVPYRTQHAGGWQWVDIWNCLTTYLLKACVPRGQYRERIIFLQKPLDDELGNQLVATMLYLDSENKKDIKLYINCSGGDVVPSLAMLDTMKYVGSDVGTVGFGGCMGMSGFLLACGVKGKRYALPNTRIMLHHPSGAARGQATDIHNEARELKRLRNYCNKVLAVATNKTVDQERWPPALPCPGGWLPTCWIQKDFNRDKYFDTKDALEYGIIDQIIRPPRSRRLT